MQVNNHIVLKSMGFFSFSISVVLSFDIITSY